MLCESHNENLRHPHPPYSPSLAPSDSDPWNTILLGEKSIVIKRSKRNGGRIFSSKTLDFFKLLYNSYHYHRCHNSNWFLAFPNSLLHSILFPAFALEFLINRSSSIWYMNLILGRPNVKILTGKFIIIGVGP